VGPFSRPFDNGVEPPLVEPVASWHVQVGELLVGFDGFKRGSRFSDDVKRIPGCWIFFGGNDKDRTWCDTSQ
jgi:hypothetical protein